MKPQRIDTVHPDARQSTRARACICVPVDLHRATKVEAARRGVSLTALVASVLSAALPSVSGVHEGKP
jgi:predicted HicB family RNase H-like nuclease